MKTSATIIRDKFGFILFAAEVAKPTARPMPQPNMTAEGAENAEKTRIYRKIFIKFQETAR
jgi:hypothetical protein